VTERSQSKMMLTMLTSKLRKLLAAAVVGLGIMIGHAAPAEELKVTADDGNLGLGFTSEYTEVSGVKLHAAKRRGSCRPQQGTARRRLTARGSSCRPPPNGSVSATNGEGIHGRTKHHAS
jgi:hypothetical protein